MARFAMLAMFSSGALACFALASNSLFMRRADELLLRDAEGRVRVRVGAREDGGFGLDLLDELGVTRSRFATKGDKVACMLRDANNSDVVRLVVTDQGAAQLRLSSARGPMVSVDVDVTRASVGVFRSRDEVVPSVALSFEDGQAGCVVQVPETNGPRMLVTADKREVRLGLGPRGTGDGLVLSFDPTVFGSAFAVGDGSGARWALTAANGVDPIFRLSQDKSDSMSFTGGNGSAVLKMGKEEAMVRLGVDGHGGVTKPFIEIRDGESVRSPVFK